MASPPLVYTCIPLVVHLNIGFFLPAEGNCGPISVLLITVARVSLGMKPGCSARVFDPSPTPPPRCATLFTWTMLVHVQTSDRLPELAFLMRAQSSSDRQIQRTVRLRLTFYCRIPVKREIEICISNNTARTKPASSTSCTRQSTARVCSIEKVWA